MKTKKISFQKTNIEVADEKFKNSIFKNVNNKVPHVIKSLPVQNSKENHHVFCLQKIKQLNPNYQFFPHFYKKELKRYFSLMIIWTIILLLCTIFEAIALYLILVNHYINNFLSLTLIPIFFLCLGLFIVHTHNYLNYFNEAKTINFTNGKIISVCINKLYKRLKTAHINVNWMCLLAYCLSLLVIFFNYICAWAGKVFHGEKISFGDLSYETHKHHAYKVILVLAIITIFITMTLHIFLLITNYIRAVKIDQYYSIQIVSDEELIEIKKQKNKRNLIIFLAIIMIFALLGILIHKHHKKKQLARWQ